MKPSKTVTRLPILGVVVLLMLTTTACVGARYGNSWPAIRLFGDAQNVLVAFNDHVALVDIRQGETYKSQDGKEWLVKDETESPSQFFSSPVMLDDETLLVAGFEGKMFLVNPETSDVRRSKRVLEGQRNTNSGCFGDCVLANPTLDNGTLYLSLMNEDVVAVNTETLDINWRFDTKGGVWAQPLVDSGVVYIVTMDHHLYALDAETGDEIWALELSGAAAAEPLLYEGQLFVGDLGRHINRISAADGTIIDQYETENWIWSTPVILDNTLYTADLGGYVYALDISDGFTEIWKQHAATKGIRPSPIVSGDTIVVASRDGIVYWLERDGGQVRTQTSLGAEILSDLLLVNATEDGSLNQSLVIVSTVDPAKLVSALPLDGGDPIWNYPPN